MSDVSGIIPINKPRDMTSKDVSRAINRRFGKIKLGHVGTLDPDADGVLVVLVGRATKLQDYLLCMPKAYQYDLLLGQATDSLDATGKIIQEKQWSHVTHEQIAAITSQFLGDITQIPPLYSAVKYQGKELYKYARAGQTEVDVPLENMSRQVTIYKLNIDDISLPKITMTANCSKGTYIRTLAADIATRLETVGHVTRLTRILASGFSIEQCITLEQLSHPEKGLSDLIIPMDSVDIGLPTWVPDDMVLLQRLVDGQRVVMSYKTFPIKGACQTFDVLAKSSDGKSVGIILVEVMKATSDEDINIKLHMKRGL